LMKGLTELASWTGVRVLVLLQYDTLDEPVYLAQAEHLVQCIPNELAILDLKSVLQAVRAQDAEEYASFFDGHMTEKGNRFVAEQIARFMEMRQWVSRKKTTP